MQNKYREMAGETSVALEAGLDRYRRPYREHGGRPTRLMPADVERIFDLYWGQDLTQAGVAARVGLSIRWLAKVLHRRHPLSRNHPKHPLEP